MLLLPFFNIRGGSQVKPGHRYRGSTFTFTHGQCVLWLEGIKPSTVPFNIKVKMTVPAASSVTGQDRNMQVQQPEIGLNCNNNIMSPQSPPGMPSIKFQIDENDQIIKDQQGGFHFWWTSDTKATILPQGITDLAPVQITIPAALAAAKFKYYISAKVVHGQPPGSLYLYQSSAPSAHPRAFLQTAAAAQKQIGEPFATITTDDQPVALPGAGPLASGNDEYLVKAIRGSTAHSRIRLTLWVRDPKLTHKEPVDSALITFEDTSNYWHFVSTRGTKSLPIPNYPIDQGRKVGVPEFPVAYTVSGLAGRKNTPHNDPYKHKDLLFIHGFNVSQSDAFHESNELYRRLYWTGFRGNFVSFDWYGNIGGSLAPAYFKSDVFNAFANSVDFLLYMEKLDSQVGPSGEVDVMAHSLGNLVACDALRYAAWGGVTRTHGVCHNLITVEAAIWREAFESQTPLHYSTNPALSTDPWYVAKRRRDQITYSVRDQREMSWRFWFNQDFQGKNYAPIQALSGVLIASYAYKDYALQAMRLGYWITKFPLYNLNAYYRTWSDTLRMPDGLNNMPEFLQVRTPNYSYADTGLPVGEVTNPEANVNINALNHGWQKKKSGLFAGDAKHSSFISSDFWLIWPWYKYLAGGSVKAFPKGVER